MAQLKKTHKQMEENGSFFQMSFEIRAGFPRRVWNDIHQPKANGQIPAIHSSIIWVGERILEVSSDTTLRAHISCQRLPLGEQGLSDGNTHARTYESMPRQTLASNAPIQSIPNTILRKRSPGAPSAAYLGRPKMELTKTAKDTAALMYQPYLQPTESTKNPPRNKPMEYPSGCPAPTKAKPIFRRFPSGK